MHKWRLLPVLWGCSLDICAWMSWRCRRGEEIWGSRVCNAATIGFKIWKDESRYFSNNLRRIWKWNNMSSLSTFHINRRRKLQKSLTDSFDSKPTTELYSCSVRSDPSQVQTHRLLHADPQASTQHTEQELSCSRKDSPSSGSNLEYCKELCDVFSCVWICEQRQQKFKQKKITVLTMNGHSIHLSESISWFVIFLQILTVLGCSVYVCKWPRYQKEKKGFEISMPMLWNIYDF